MSDTNEMNETTDTTSWTHYVLDGQAWLRFLFMLLLTPLLGCVGFMVLCVALFQFFSVLATGENNPQLRALGADLNRLGMDIVAFLTYNTERKPFAPRRLASEQTPARGDNHVAEGSRSENKSATSRSSRSATTRKKAASRKKTAHKKKTTRKRTGGSGASRRSGSASSSGSSDSPTPGKPAPADE